MSSSETVDPRHQPAERRDHQPADHQPADWPADRREERFGELFHAYHAKVLAYARRRLGADAEDAVADAFLAAWTNLDRISGEPLLWLYGLTRGAVSHHRRRLGRIDRLNRRSRDMGVAPHSLDPAEMVGWEDRFTAAFAALNEADQEVLRLTTWEHLGPSEGSVVLGCTAAAFKVRLHRARRRLRHLLEADRLLSRHAPADRNAAATLPLSERRGAGPGPLRLAATPLAEPSLRFPEETP